MKITKKTLIVAAIVIVIATLIHNNWPTGTEGQPTLNFVASAMNKKPDEWLLAGDDTNAPMAEMAAKSLALYASAAVAKYKSLAAMRGIAEAFGNTVFHTAIVKQYGGVFAVDNFKVGDPFVCVVPRISKNETRHLAYFDRSILTGCLALWAVRWGDDGWRDAVYLHELLHYLRHRQHALSSKAPDGSELYAGEEAEAHMLVSEVLNASTMNRYHTELRTVFEQSARSNLWDTLKVAAPKLGSKVDGLFGQAIDSEASLRAAQYSFEIARMWFEKRGEKNPAVKGYMVLRNQ